MSDRMKRIVVTPAGRKRYMELLLKHLKCQREAFDEWHLWLNTTVQEDINWMQSLIPTHSSFIKLINAPGSNPKEGNWNIHRFFPMYTDLNTVYLRLDDDVVWLEPDFLEKMFSRREEDKSSFLVSANVVNNAICSHLVSKSGVIRPCGYECMDHIGWKDPKYAEHVHRTFLNCVKIDALHSWKFNDKILEKGKRISINGISWRGDTFAKFRGQVGRDEEKWLTVEAPPSWGPVVVNGSAICVHFAFCTQRGHIDSTDLLHKYSELADQARIAYCEKCLRRTP